MRLIFCCLLVAALCLPGARAATDDAITLIDIAGRQRMLSQRLVKTHVQQLQGVQADSAQVTQTESIALFESNLARLAQHPDAQAQQDLAALRAQWSAFLPLLTPAGTPPVLRPAMQVNREAERLLDLAQALTARLDALAAQRQGALVNQAGRLRMLSQRLAKNYLLRSAGADGEPIGREMQTAQEDFDATLEQLCADPALSAAKRSELDAVALYWDWFRQALALDGALSYALVVADASERLLNHLERLVALYSTPPAQP